MSEPEESYTASYTPAPVVQTPKVQEERNNLDYFNWIMRLANIDHNRECVFVADEGSKVIGFIHVEIYEILYAPSMANILGIAVSSEYRRQGIGKLLLSKAEEWAKCKGINMMRLNSGAERIEAHEFYRGLGYNDEKTQIRFIKSL